MNSSTMTTSPSRHHVFFISLLHHLGIKSVLDEVDQVEVFGVVKVANLGPPLHFGDAVLAQGDAFGPFIDGVVLLKLKAGHQLGEGVILLNRLLGRTADDQGRTGFVDQDVVHLVHDGVMELPLHPLG